MGLLMIGVVSACNLGVTLVNQDPYPAVPGEYVTAVFQVTGVSDPQCGTVTFEPLLDFPFSLDPGVSPRQSVVGGTVVPGSNQFRSFMLATYKFRVDEAALDGDTRIRTAITGNNLGDGGGQTTLVKNFTINIEATDVDFEVAIKDYDKTTNTLTFEILNIGENDVEAVTVEIPRQANIVVKGANRNIVGGLDANDDTTFTFEATPEDGDIELDIFYTDTINVRRETTKIVTFDSSYFTGRAGEQQSTSPWFYITIILVIGIGFFWWRARKKKSMKKRRG